MSDFVYEERLTTLFLFVTDAFAVKWHLNEMVSQRRGPESGYGFFHVCSTGKGKRFSRILVRFFAPYQHR
jgi:hypothetical protein